MAINRSSSEVSTKKEIEDAIERLDSLDRKDFTTQGRLEFDYLLQRLRELIELSWN